VAPAQPRGLLIFVAADEQCEAVVATIADAARSGNESGTGSTGRRRSPTSPTTERRCGDRPARVLPSVRELTAVDQRPFDWFGEIPGAAG